MRNICLFFLLFNVFIGCAQSKVEGRIVDEERKGLPYITVRILDSDSTFVYGTTTDSIGVFRAENIPSGNYIFLFSSIGYKNKMLPVDIKKSVQSLESVILQSDNIQLSEVEVKGRAFIRQKDRVLIIPDKQQVKHAGTGYDLLNNLMIPGINVDRQSGSVTTIGGTVTLYIDGHKATFREVQSLRPRDIEKIEYFDAPSGKYSDDIASINYITKQYKSGGYVSLDGKQAIGYLNGDYNLVARIAKGNTKYTLYGGYNTQKYGNMHNDLEEVIKSPDYTVNRNQEITHAEVKNYQRYMQLKVIKSTQKNSLMGNFSLVQNETPDNYVYNRLTYQGYNEKNYETKEMTDGSNLMPKISLMGIFNLPRKQVIEAGITGTYTQNDYWRNYQEDIFISQTDVKENVYNLQGGINYTKDLKNRNTFSAQLSHNHQVSSSTYQGDYNTWSHLWTGETLFYLDYNGHIGEKFTFRLHPGFSYLQYKLHGNEKVDQFSPRLNIRGIYRISPTQQFSANLNIGNTFPKISTLNSVDQKVDSLQIRRGNPNLDNANIYTAILTYNIQIGKVNVQADGYYNSFLHCTSNNYYIEENKLISSYVSDADFRQWEADLSIAWKICEQWRLKMNAGVGQFFLSRPIDENRTSYYLSAQTSYYIGDFAINLDGTLAKRTIDFSGTFLHAPGKYSFNVSWNHGGWMIEAGCNNLFLKHKRHTSSLNREVYRSYQSQSSKLNQQTGYVKLSYTVDFGKKTSRVKDGVDRTINSAILKAK